MRSTIGDSSKVLECDCVEVTISQSATDISSIEVSGDAIFQESLILDRNKSGMDWVHRIHASSFSWQYDMDTLATLPNMAYQMSLLRWTEALPVNAYSSDVGTDDFLTVHEFIDTNTFVGNIMANRRGEQNYIVYPIPLLAYKPYKLGVLISVRIQSATTVLYTWKVKGTVWYTREKVSSEYMKAMRARYSKGSTVNVPDNIFVP